MIPSQKLATVVIPTYKRPQAVHRAILSVLAQTCTSLEIIVVDDNGINTPTQIQTAEILKPFIDNGTIQYLVNEINSGGSFSRNQGLSIATGKYITFLDDAFKGAHPEIPVEKKSDFPDEDKSVGDSSSLHPVLTDYFALHPRFSPDTFLGDSAFDTIATYSFLKDEFYFSKS